jgi:UPF0755 protein
MYLKYKRYLYFNRREVLLIAGIFLFFFLVPWIQRTLLLYDTDALNVEDSFSIYISEETLLPGLLDILEEKPVSFNRDHVKWATRLEGWRRARVGHYSYEPRGYHADEFFKKMAMGNQDPVNVTILPGRTLGSVVDQISSQLYADSLEIMSTFQDSTVLADLGIPQEQVIGHLLPETYQTFWTVKPSRFLGQINATFKRLIFEKHQQAIEDSKYTIDEIVTLASIVEWEANVDEEKPTVAGLYLNRLRKGWRLQADPTVNFALGERRRLTYADYQFDHPYNTYLNRGLPPGPITNPSESSILAVLYPEDHNYMFMVATPEGVHDFSRTYAEHQKKTAKWQQWIRKQYRIKRERERAEQ